MIWRSSNGTPSFRPLPRRAARFLFHSGSGLSGRGAIAYLYGGGYREVAHTLVNALATISGMICDGAKPSCAAKIAAAVDAGILGYHMFRSGQQFRGGEGIVTKGIEAVIPWFPLPETMMTGFSQPLIRASDPAAAMYLARVFTSSP